MRRFGGIKDNEMKRTFISVFFIGMFCFSSRADVLAQEAKNISRSYRILSVYYAVPDNEKKYFDTINFRYGWADQAPYSIAIQFFNPGYNDRKLKFAIKDVTSGQMIMLDQVHNSNFGTENLKANSDGEIWAGQINSLKDTFSLRVWNADGDELEQAPISILNAWMPKTSRAVKKNQMTPTRTYTSTPTWTAVVPVETHAVLTETMTVTPVPSLTSTIAPPSSVMGGMAMDGLRINSSAQVLTLTVTGTQPLSSTPTRTLTFTRTPTFTKTPHFTHTSTPTITPTATYTPTKSQTALPEYKCLFIAIGDSYTEGMGASSQEKGFAYLSYQQMKNWYPGMTFINDGCSGSTPGAWKTVIPDQMDKFLKKQGVPLGYVMFQTGPLSFFMVHREDCLSCCKGASISEGVSFSYAYQKQMDDDISAIYAVNPNVKLVLLGIPDTSGGTGTYAPVGIYEAYRERLFELKSKYPKMRIVDLYTILKGRTDCYVHNTDHKDHPNDFGQVLIEKGILEQFRYWPGLPIPPLASPTPLISSVPK
jgi:hypothetical protein